MRLLRSLRNRLPVTDELFLASVVLIVGSGMAWYVYASGLTKALTDQSSHLNFSRLIFDSITPGISQLGFWPPLLHLLLAPFVAVPFLYRTGLAGVFVLLPCLVIATIVFYRITLHLTKSRPLSLLACSLFCFNPYILYYSVTPMMEMLFICNLLIVAYVTLQWLETSKLRYLLAMGLFVSLACLSRFEGFVLLPIVGSIVLLQVIRRKKSYHEIEALLILFGLLAVIGITMIVSYSWVFGDSPLAFTGGSWLRDPAASLRPARLNLANTLRDAISASYYMLGEPLVVSSVISFLLLLLFKQRRFHSSAILLILASPLLFVLFSLYTGSITINVPEFPPYDIFHNDRYSLTWIGFVILAPLLLVREINGKLSARFRSFSFTALIGVPVLTLLAAFNLMRFEQIAFAQRFDAIRRNFNSPVSEQGQVARYLANHYDGGKILMARVDNDPILAAAGIPLNDYVYEGNYRYFDQVMKEPWFFVRWVVMHDPGESDDQWAEQNEPVYRQWGESEEFRRYFDLVLENGKRRVYALNENHLLQIAKESNYNLGAIPSLNPDSDTWASSRIYADMRTPEARRMDPALLAKSKGTVKGQLMDFYWNRLKPDFERGYFLNEEGKGNSESQSYALLQSLWMDDPETFDRVWDWTKRNLQRDDGLFSWQFDMAGNGRAVITDENSATDADTDIAYALLLAAKRWSRPALAAEALPIVESIWEKETAVTPLGRHVIAGNWANESGTLVINPSYFSPAAYRLFAAYDPEHDWKSVIDTGYDDIRQSAETARERTGKFLPPDWAQIGEDLVMKPFSLKNNSFDYSFDAFRTFWRLALDARESKDPRAAAFMRDVTAFDEEWEERDRLCSLYLFSAPSDDCHLDMGTLAGAVSVWTMQGNRARTEDILETFSLAGGRADIAAESSFYEKSWYWFMLWQWSHTNALLVSR